MAEPAAPAVALSEETKPELKPEQAEVAQPAPVKDEKPAEASAKAEDPAPSGAPSDGDVVAKLREYLTDDSMTMDVTERQLRTRLEEHFGAPLKDRKAIIRNEVVAWLSEKQATQEVEDEDEEEKPKKKRKGGGGLAAQCILSEPLQKFLGTDRMARTQVVKSIWNYIKANNLQKPENKRKIILDDKLSTVFNPPLDMFNMNKQLTKHIFVDDTPQDEEEEEGEKPKRKRQKKSTDDDDFKPKKAGGFTMQLAVSEELSAWLGGAKHISRPELTKFFWAYARENELLNPSNKREVICDETLKKLTGQDRFLAFSFAKYMKGHLLGKADVDTEAAEVKAEAEESEPEAEISDAED